MERHELTVEGIVQGVGFRPFVHALASRLGLAGFVRSCRGAVRIEVEGEREALGYFLDELHSHAPPLARIDDIRRTPLPLAHDPAFRIEHSVNDSNSVAESTASGSEVFISPDTAVCDDCLKELFDPADRRYRYPFLNCTHCGPRLTIIRGAPYDRSRTTMSDFPMCPDCRAEYEDSRDRRFHAQPIACPACGPHLEVSSASGEPVPADNPLDFFATSLLRGRIGALKGQGGFHLVCDARCEEAVHELRKRKHRDEKPFAVMVADVASALALCELNPHEEQLLCSRRRPVVLLRRQIRQRVEPINAGCEPVSCSAAVHDAQDTHFCQSASGVCETVAPHNPLLGVMLPYTPLHYLLMEAVDGIPLVMTSGNRSDEPIAYRNDEALENLRGIADVFLTHNRPIQVRCDDSVTRSLDRTELPVRRSRGCAPEPVRLPLNCPAPVLAVGGQLKGVFALGRAHQAFLSHHLGDLDHLTARNAFERDIQLYEQLFEVRPELIVHDLHPDYTSTTYARQRAADEKIELIGVQHHHAHVASCMAENGLEEPVIGVSFDGAGFGTDEAVWGGEFLVGDYCNISRAAHFRYVRMPGGDKAAREPWRMAAAHLLDAGRDWSTLLRNTPGATDVPGASRTSRKSQPVPAASPSERERLVIRQLLEGGLNSPYTSSVGRLFDAVAAIAGLCSRVTYEAQAALQLEWLATEVTKDGIYPFDLTDDGPAPHDCITIDTRPLIRAVESDVQNWRPAAMIARRFHSTLVEIIVRVCNRIRMQTDLDAVALTGGVFMNALLTREVTERLQSEHFRVFRHQQVPPGDGGLSLGQLAIAAKRLSNPESDRSA